MAAVLIFRILSYLHMEPVSFPHLYGRPFSINHRCHIRRSRLKESAPVFFRGYPRFLKILYRASTIGNIFTDFFWWIHTFHLIPIDRLLDCELENALP
jgi:hypothetical protein